MRQSLYLIASGALTLLLAAPVHAQQPPRHPTVAILDFTNSALVDHETYEPFARGIGDILTTELSQSSAITLVERDRLLSLLEEQNLLTAKRVDPATAARVGKLLGAQYVLVGGFVIDRRERLRLDARAVNVETSEVAYVETASGDAEDLLDIVAKLAEQMNRRMELPPLRSADAKGSRGSAQKGKLQALLFYSTALVEEERRRPERAKAMYERFLSETSPDFAVEQRQRAEERLRVLSGTL